MNPSTVCGSAHGDEEVGATSFVSTVYFSLLMAFQAEFCVEYIVAVSKSKVHVAACVLYIAHAFFDRVAENDQMLSSSLVAVRARALVRCRLHATNHILRRYLDE